MGVTDASGATTSFEYDEEGQRTAVIDAGGARSTFRFDAARRLVAATDALGNVTRTEYDEAGNVTARVDARGSRTTLSYDRVGRLTGVVDAEGHASSTLYCGDLDGQPCSQIDPLGNVTEATFDALGRVLTTTDPNGNVTAQSYDSLGRRTTATDANGSTTSFGYDSLGRLTSVADAQGNVIAYRYDARGNRSSVTDANGGVTNLVYDLTNRLLSETDPVGIVTSFTYDPAGNRATKTDGSGAVTTYSYDGNRRLVRVDFADGSAYDFAFDPLGGRSLERSPSHERGLAYDSLHRLEHVEDRTLGKTITNAYDANGNRTARSLNTGEATRTRWDGGGRLVELVDPDGEVYRFFYDAAGRRSRVTFPNRTTASYSYSPAGEVRSIVYAGPVGDVLTAFHYTYDATGNRLSKTFADGTAEVYGYDTLNRLTDVSYPSGRAVHYDLDPLGNRLALTETTAAGSTTETYVYNLFNQLLSVTGPGGITRFEYDGNGNQSRKIEPGGGVTGYLWDLDNRLRAVAEPGASADSAFDYDANGLRVSIEDSAGARDQLLDGLSVVAEYDAAGARTAWYNQSPARIDELLSVANAHGKHFVQADALGSIYRLSDPAGAIAARADYDVFGVHSGDVESLGLGFGFTGRERAAGGLDYNRARYVSAQEGRWVSIDPMGSIDGPNTYLFASQNPARYSDPSGRTIYEWDESPRLFVGLRGGHEVPIALIAGSSTIHGALDRLEQVRYNLGFWRLFNVAIGEGAVNPGAIKGGQGAIASGITIAPRCGLTHDHPAIEIVSIIDLQQAALVGEYWATKGMAKSIEETVAHELGHAMGVSMNRASQYSLDPSEFQGFSEYFACDEQLRAHRALFGNDLVESDRTWSGCSHW